MIIGSKVILREKKLSDAPDDYAWEIDPELARLDAATPLNLSFSYYASEYASELRNPPRTSIRLAIDTLDGKHIGNCSCYNIDEANGETEIGIMIGDRDYWSKGYGTSAIASLLEYVFHETKLDRVYLKTLVSNLRAQKCFQKCGFTPYSRTSKEGYNFLLMETSRKEWEALQQNTCTDCAGSQLGRAESQSSSDR